ncbi:MAG TPA: DNA replication/repair protein RecF [Longimicrobiales bacterium]|nr:DNA replication/repair protein RecF [Longimicrobiales bacterium]
MTVVPPPHVCRSVRLRQFRNFAELDLTLPVEGVAIIGDNGSGKTNFIEALYYCEIFRSFRGAPDEQLVRFGEPAFHIRAVFQQGARERAVTAAFERAGRRKRVTVDGVEPERIGDALGQAGAVVFSPSDVGLIDGPPGGRRRFLDILLSLHEPGYLTALQQYRQILRQRNAELRRGGPAASSLEVWNDALVRLGARITTLRVRWVERYRAAFLARTAAIAGGPGIEMVYATWLPADIDLTSESAVTDEFSKELRRVAQRERERGMTLVGPHRDDLRFTLQNGNRNVDVREFGSGGQRRTAAVALRMMEAATLRAVRGFDPIILLDDVFAELDPGRAERILEILEAEERGQVVLTAPKASDVMVRAGALPRWRIQAGRIFA